MVQLQHVQPTGTQNMKKKHLFLLCPPEKVAEMLCLKRDTVYQWPDEVPSSKVKLIERINPTLAADLSVIDEIVGVHRGEIDARQQDVAPSA